jgi:hypothetical protein
MTQSHSLRQAAHCLTPDQLAQLRVVCPGEAERLFNQVTGILNIDNLLNLNSEDRENCLYLYEYIKDHLVNFPPEQLKWEYVINNTENCLYKAVIAIFEPLNNESRDL